MSTADAPLPDSPPPPSPAGRARRPWPSRSTRRRVGWALLLLAGVAPFAAVLSLAAYYRSSFYRSAVERRLTAFFGLPTRVGRVTCLSWHQRRILDVELFLPDATGRMDDDNRIAFCRQADWVAGERPGRFELILRGGQLDLTPARWARGDWKRLERSLRHDYPTLGLDRVSIRQSAVRWARGDFAIELDNAEGEIWFAQRAGKLEGVALLSADSLNAAPANVVVHARFDPTLNDGNGPDEAGLVRGFDLMTNPGRVAPIPIAQLRLEGLIGRPVTHGHFTGRLSYRAADDGGRHVLTVADAELSGLQLADFSSLQGRLDLTVAELQIEQAASQGPDPASPARGFVITRADLAGELSDLDLASALRALDLPAVEGTMRLRLHKADLQAGLPVRELTVAARAEGLQLEQLTALLAGDGCDGRVRGPASLSDFKLHVRDGKLIELAAELVAQLPAAPAAATTIDWSFIEVFAPDAAKLKGTAVESADALPYRLLKAHFASAADKLIVGGFGGTDGRHLMTVTVPLVARLRTFGLPSLLDVNVAAPGPDKPFDLAPVAKRLAQPLAPMALGAVTDFVRQRLLPIGPLSPP